MIFFRAAHDKLEQRHILSRTLWSKSFSAVPLSSTFYYYELYMSKQNRG